MDTKTFFEKYVFGWMISDLEKALEASRVERDAGRDPYGRHFLALSLLQYSEFMGSLEAKKYQLTTFTQQFKHFLVRWMGGAYKSIIGRNDVYWEFRGGMAHHFFVQPYCTIVLFNDTTHPFKVYGEEPPYEVARPGDGLGITPNGNYYIVIEQYLKDFKRACEDFYQELTKPKPKDQPPPYIGWPGFGSTGGFGDTG